MNENENLKILEAKIEKVEEVINPVIISLMMALNHLNSYYRWYKLIDEDNSWITHQDRVYNFYITCATLAEIFKGYKNIKDDPTFISFINDPKYNVKNDHDYLMSGEIQTFVRDKLMVIRNKITFHYDQDAIKNGIEQFINEKKAKQSDVTIAVTEKEKSIDTFFEIAKDISLKILYNNLNISTREFVSNFSSDIRTTIKDIIPKMLKIFGDYITYCLIDNR